MSYIASWYLIYQHWWNGNTHGGDIGVYDRVYIRGSLHMVDSTNGGVYTRWSIYAVESTHGGAYTRWSLHTVWFIPCGVYTHWSLHTGKFTHGPRSSLHGQIYRRWSLNIADSKYGRVSTAECIHGVVCARCSLRLHTVKSTHGGVYTWRSIHAHGGVIHIAEYTQGGVVYTRENHMKE